MKLPPLALNEIVKAGEAILKELSAGDVANVTSFVSKRKDHHSNLLPLGRVPSCGFQTPLDERAVEIIRHLEDED